MNDSDGAFGFLPADYGSANYPNPLKVKATRFREEHAKRPVNVKTYGMIPTPKQLGTIARVMKLFVSRNQIKDAGTERHMMKIKYCLYL